LARPEERAAGRENGALPCRRQDASAVRVAEFGEGFHLEVEPTEVEQFELRILPTKGEKRLHEI
jgi:hypothetical protein